jgi:hypothetical protein
MTILTFAPPQTADFVILRPDGSAGLAATHSDVLVHLHTLLALRRETTVRHAKTGRVVTLRPEQRRGTGIRDALRPLVA